MDKNPQKVRGCLCLDESTMALALWSRTGVFAGGIMAQQHAPGVHVRRP
jgi:hypothetical protein